MKRFIIILTAFYFFPNSVYAECKDVLYEIQYKDVCTKIRTFKSKQLSKKPILLVALHGDTAPWDFSIAQYRFAEHVANENKNVISVGMLRPGYKDSEKRTSDGVQGEGIGDNYDEQRVFQIAKSILLLKEHYQASKVILVGQSGGAATAANLIALYPDLINHAQLIACPCDINHWRKNMLTLTRKPVFEGELDNVSPIDIVGQISDQISITILVGNNDLVTPPALNRKYHSALVKAGKDAKFIMIKGDHEIFLSSEALSEISEVISNYNNTLQRTSR